MDEAVRVGHERLQLRIVSDTLAGGLGALVRREAEWFATRGWETAVVAPDDGASPEAPVRRVELPSVRSARAVGQVGRAVRSLRLAWRREGRGATVVHVHGLRSLLLARLAGLPTPFVSVHGTGRALDDPVGYAWLRERWLSVVPRLAHQAITGEPGYGRGWTYLVHASPLLSDMDQLPFPEAGSVPTVGWLGLLDHRKQPEVFVRAVQMVAATGAPIRGLLGGTGPRQAEIESLVAELGAPVEVLGHVAPAAVLQPSWALALFARSEGTPLAVMEAMWAGRAVVGSPLPGIEHLVGDTGRLTADVEAAAEAMRGLATDHEEARRRGDLAATRIRELVAPDDPWPAMDQAFRAYLARRDGSPGTGSGP